MKPVLTGSSTRPEKILLVLQRQKDDSTYENYAYYESMKNDGWQHTWQELPKYRRNSNSGEWIETIYTVEEWGQYTKTGETYTKTASNVVGYRAPETERTDPVASSSDVSEDDLPLMTTNVKITNTYDSASKKFTIRAYKAWHPVLNNLYPDSVILKLEAKYYDEEDGEYKPATISQWVTGEPYSYLEPDYQDSHETVYTTSEVEKEITLGTGEKWEDKVWSWENLPVAAHGYPIEYSVVEVAPLGYSFKLLTAVPTGYDTNSAGIMVSEFPILGTAENTEGWTNKYIVLENQPGAELPSTGNRFGSRNDIYMMSILLLAGAAICSVLRMRARKRNLEEEIAWASEYDPKE